MADTEQISESRPAAADETSSENKDDNSFGIAEGRIPDNSLFSSSAMNQSSGASQARLHKQPCKEKYGAWTPLYDDKNQYLDIDLGDVVQVGAIATQGRPNYTEDGGWFVESYSVAYGNDGDNFQNLREYGISKVFEGNIDPETVVKNQLKSVINCRYVRIKPVTWHNHIALRVEIYKFTGNSQSSRKRSAPQRQSQKSTAANRGPSRPNARSSKPPSVMEDTSLVMKPELPGRMNDVQQISVVETASDTKNEELLQLNDKEDVAPNGLDVTEKDPKTESIKQESFEIIEPAEHRKEESLALGKVLLAADTISEKTDNESISQKSSQPEVIPSVSVRNQTNVFESRPEIGKIGPAYRNIVKGASAVATRNDGSKFIGKIKLVKREEPQVEENADEEPTVKKGPEYVIPDVVKERLTSYQDVVLRKKENRQDLSKRKSLALEEDLKYREEMESSVFDRLKIFKETESKSKENMEMSKQEEEKRQSLKRDAEKRRSLAMQKEKERMLMILQKQKEEEEEQRRQREAAEAEKFVEINAEVDGTGVPAVVNDRLKLFKESERQEKEKQEAVKAEAEKRRLAKENAERKRESAIQKERERLQELMDRKQEELELKRLEEESKSDDTEEDLIEEPVVPAIVHDRIKMFKDSEKANSEKQQALRREAQKKRAAEDDVERSRMLTDQRLNNAAEELTLNGHDRGEDQNEEEVIVVEENFNVESEISFDFMEPTQQDSREEFIEKDENQNQEEALDFQEKLENIDTHHDGYDPDHERRMLEEAEEAFRSFAAHQKVGNRPKRSAKTESLIKSFTSSQSDNAVYEKQQRSLNVTPIKREKEKSVEERVVAGKQEEVHAAVINNTITADAKANDSTMDKDVCLTGLVRGRASLFSQNTPPVSGDKLENANAHVKKWIASQPSQEAESTDEERLPLSSQLEEMEKNSKRLTELIEKYKLEQRDEEALELEEELHATMMEISKTKRKLLKLEKDHERSRKLVKSSSLSSGPCSVPDDNLSDKASSLGSRSQKGSSSGKLSRECKAPLEKPQPLVDANAFNDDGEVVVEGNVLSQIKTYEQESARQRKKMAEIRKSLSLSRSSLDSYDNPPPMGFGGPEFAKDKSKSSRECKLPRDTPAPPVDHERFNDDGDCVPEGNVQHQTQLFSRT